MQPRQDRVAALSGVFPVLQVASTQQANEDAEAWKHHAIEHVRIAQLLEATQKDSREQVQPLRPQVILDQGDLAQKRDRLAAFRAVRCVQSLPEQVVQHARRMRLP